MRKDMNGSVAVVGAGIAGIQASLDLADAGFKVFLIEKKPAIGGFMAMLDKTFPTNDCSLCILSPKLVECGRHKDIEILTRSSVEGIDGEPGDFSLTVHKEPRFVDLEKCTSCGECAEKCPISIPNEYEQGLSFRKAIYKYYPQAIPNAWLIDKQGYPPDFKGCVECRLCEKVCGVGAINFDDQPEDIEVKVGAVILTEGSAVFQPYIKEEYGYGRFVNVVTSLEYERILSASGPYNGHVVRPGDRQKPDKIAWIQCVGSRDQHVGNNYCSSVCCMYAVKEAIITKEHEPEIDASIFFIDMRAFGKDFDKYVDRSEKVHGVNYVRSRISEIVEDPETNDLLVRYETDDGELLEERFGMVILSVGFCPDQANREQLEKLGIELNQYGFCRTDYGEPVKCYRDGVFAAGSLNQPMAIPESVMQASAAASRAAALLHQSRGTRLADKEYPPEKDVSSEEPRIGIFVCHCGTNIAGYLDIDELTKFAAGLPGVIYADHPMYTCAQDSQKQMADLIREHDLNRVVVAACSPRTHEELFRETLREAGLNPYLFEMANIRDQCSWIHMTEKQSATEKAKDLIAMAAAKARLLEPIPIREVDVTSSALVVGGGVAGMTAALSLAEMGFRTALAEKEEILGGRLNRIRETIEGMDVDAYIEDLSQKVQNHELIDVYAGCEVESIEGFVGNFKSRIRTKDNTVELEHGAVILAMGAEDADTEDYMYNKNPRVITQHDLEEFLEDKTGGELERGETFVMIQCVQSRNDDFPYCSRICCTQAVKNALHIKNVNPDAEVYILYRDIRTYGFREEYYEEARNRGVVFLRYEQEEPPVVETEGEKLRVRVNEKIMRREIVIPADHVVLSLGLRPPQGRERMAGMLKVPLNEDGYFLEAHVKLRPVDFATEGVFLAGTCHAPKFIDETVAQARATSGRAGMILSKDKYRSAAVVAESNPDLCSGCGVCVSVCDYSAIELVEKTEGEETRIKSEVNQALCKGCGSCVAACPGGAMEQKGFTTKQLEGMLSAALHAQTEIKEQSASK